MAYEDGSTITERGQMLNNVELHVVHITVGGHGIIQLCIPPATLSSPTAGRKMKKNLLVQQAGRSVSCANMYMLERTTISIRLVSVGFPSNMEEDSERLFF